MSKPLMFDLCCGLGGATGGFLAEGWDCYGVDIEQHVYGEHRYPATLWLQDIRTIHGRQLRDASFIWASVPCQEFSYTAMPWSRGKQIARALRGEDEFPAGYRGSRTIGELTALFDACFRIQREASEAAGRHIPMIIENVRGAEAWVGKARGKFGSFYLWGDVPALMPVARGAIKNPGLNWSAHTEPDYRTSGKGRCFRDSAVKVPSLEPGRRTDVGKGARFTSRDCGLEGIKQRGSGRDWSAGEGTIGRTTSSKSLARKRASAMIAKIPEPLSRYIAATFKP